MAFASKLTRESHARSVVAHHLLHGPPEGDRGARCAPGERSTLLERDWAHRRRRSQIGGYAADLDTEGSRMKVVAVSTPSSREWRRRIVDYSGQMVEGPMAPFPRPKAPSSECAPRRSGCRQHASSQSSTALILRTR